MVAGGIAAKKGVFGQVEYRLRCQAAAYSASLWTMGRSPLISKIRENTAPHFVLIGPTNVRKRPYRSGLVCLTSGHRG
jgi:hypothetical protein